jgi:hypothetical protein
MDFGTVDANGDIRLLANQGGTPTPKITLQFTGGDSFIYSGQDRLYIYAGGIDTGTGNGPGIILEGGYGGPDGGNGGLTRIRGGSAGTGVGGGNGGGVDIEGQDGDVSGNGGSIRFSPGLNAGVGNVGTIDIIPPISGTAASSLRFLEDSPGLNFAAFKAPSNITANATYTWPPAPPAANGYVLTATTLGVMSWDPAGAAAAQVFRANLTEAGSDDFVINTGFGNGANVTVSITVRDNNNTAVQPDNITFDATPDQVTINLASYRDANGGTLPAGFQVLAVG